MSLSSLAKLSELAQSTKQFTLGALTNSMEELEHLWDAAKDDQSRSAIRPVYLEFLKKTLGEAVGIEFATIPPYLCALWSIKHELNPYATSIREVVQEEMLHMVLVCNMLAGLGGVPEINSRAPIYPMPLPYCLAGGMDIFLSGLNNDALELFMAIERPDAVIEHGHPEHGSPSAHEGNTIGRFYARIANAIERLQPEFDVQRQLCGPPVVGLAAPTKLKDTLINNPKDALEAIGVICEQGEGSKKSPVDTGEKDLSHYYRFDELRVGRRIVVHPDGTFGHGDSIGFPETWPMARMERFDAEAAANLPEEVQILMNQFDVTYSEMLDHLQGCWTGKGHAGFFKSLECMFRLERYAIPLMKTQRHAGNDSTYGPRFRYIPLDDR